MDRFLVDEAYIAHIEREASTTVVFYEGKLIGYFTLKRSMIRIEGIEENIHALDLARLAVAEQYQGKGFGTYIINYIKQIAYLTNERFIQTDAVFERWPWYKDRGFEPVIEEELDPKTNSDFVYMIMDLYDEQLVKEYFDA